MRLLEFCEDGTICFEDFRDDKVPPYAILSHTWLRDQDGKELEPTYEDLINGTGKEKLGYKKIQFCSKQASNDGLRYFWVDSCCIDREMNAELSQAIRSMFLWYRNATRCYVYLSDVSTRKRKRGYDETQGSWEQAFRRSKWFARGWTLQELLAPQSVEFFSQECKRLGDRGSLREQIHEITCIPLLALEGTPLSQFSVKERFLWMEHRQTTSEEDKAYSLLGIFGVSLYPLYGEGVVRAYKRLQEEIDKLEKCKQALHLTDPRKDKERIEDGKGGLLAKSYLWILDHPDFKHWREDQQSHLLWIKGDPGKGKTMLLCGVINELEKLGAETYQLSYFFCQATDSRINNAVAVLRGLLSLLIEQQPSLISHIQKRYDVEGRNLFEDANAWVALSDIFTNILLDSSLIRTYLIIDALDECKEGQLKLVDFIVQKSSLPSRVKWIVSSRNWPPIEEQLDKAGNKVRLCLELNNEFVSASVNVYIQHKVNQLAQEKEFDEEIRGAILSHLVSKADNTFLWVALMYQFL
ncbi:hypothetical protein OIDMADRAFT_184255 [Oidiodendron maius Zn]|uniref:NACHT domain-containing protein n=1 Tax=Oidiodendron maius (strain Zn) TaxID=913774 RepID=A0A0C3GW87_OIDMZ|nr:hypothetical protein OIDMADRAFT_184255 [Oidiodendron maius Zn]